MNVTLGSIVVIFSINNSSKRGVIIDRAAIGSFREISLYTTYSECNKSEPFEGTDRQPLNVIEGDGEHMNVLVIEFQIDVDHFV